MTTATLSLPTEAQANEALLTRLGTDGVEEPWREMVLQCLDYGTNYKSACFDAAVAVEGVGSGSGPVGDGTATAATTAIDPEKIEECTAFLSSAIQRYDDSIQASSNSTSPSNVKLDAYSCRARSIVVDAFWLLGNMLDASAPNSSTGTTSTTTAAGTTTSSKFKNSHQALVQILNLLTIKPITKKESTEASKPIQPVLPSSLLSATLDMSLLEHVSNIFPQTKSDPTPLGLFVKKLRKTNTDMYYRQKKVNLLQEESEGYAKLVCFLLGLEEMVQEHYRDSTRSSEVVSSTEVLNTIKEWIGAFDLDPNRVLDLTLDALEWNVQALLDKKLKSLNASSNVDTEIYNCLTGHGSGHIAETIHLILEIVRMFQTESNAHLIGFKFASYTDAPKSLYITTAILAANSLLDVKLLLPHLQPRTDTINQHYRDWKKKTSATIRKMGNVSLNSSKKKDGESKAAELKKEEEELASSLKQHQFIQLFHTFLQLGFQWERIVQIFETSKDDGFLLHSVCLYTPIGNSLCHYIRTMIDSLYKVKVGEINMNVAPKILQRPTENITSNAPAIIPLSVTIGATIDPSSTTLLELIQSLMNPLIPMVAAGAIANDPVLYSKICRIVRVLLLEHVEENGIDLSSPDMDLGDSVYHMLETFLVPSLSLFPSNPSISSELWSILNLLPYQFRYALYSSWKKHGLGKDALFSFVQPPKSLKQIESEVKTSIDIKYLLKRVSKHNIKEMGRQISKVAHNNPLVVFDAIIDQIQAYDNFIQMLVDTFRYMTLLSLDVMGFCLLVSLGGGDGGQARNKLQADGVNAAQWLSSLESFTGAYYKKFTDVEIKGLIAYLTKRLNDGHLVEVGVLQGLLKTVGGYSFALADSTAALSQAQLDGRKGSKILFLETSHFGVVEKVNVRSVRKLRSVLQTDDCGVAILILLCQIRSRILFGESKDGVSKEIKLIGNLHDNCEKTFYLLQAFLVDDTDDGDGKGSIAMYASSLPTLAELHKTFGVHIALAWMLCRPLIREALSKSEMPEYLKPFDPCTESMHTLYRSMLPEDSWNHFTILLFERFYSYSIYDLSCPEEQYKIQIARLRKEMDQLQRGGREAIAMQASEVDRLKRSVDILERDMAKQQKHCERIRKKLEQDKDAFFLAEPGSVGRKTAGAFLTHCIFPRCMLTPEDGMYCTEFIVALHKFGTPGFSILQFIDVFIDAVIGALYCITEEEAGNLGLLLEGLWKVASSWRYNETVYKEEVAGKVKHDGTLTFDDYTALYNRWHSDLGSSLIGCLKSSEYMHNRTSLIILQRIVRQYPTKSILGGKLLRTLSSLQGEENEKKDIKVMALACHSQIEKARDDGVWKEEDSKTAKARVEREAKLQEEKKKKYEKQFEEMKAELESQSQERGWSNRSSQPQRRPQMLPASSRSPPRLNGRFTSKSTPSSSANPSTTMRKRDRSPAADERDSKRSRLPDRRSRR